MSVGDEVYGLIMGYRDGAAAQYIAVEAHNVAPKPKSLDHVHAAALPQAGLTSWQALFDHGHLEAGQSVVIHGAGGALGLVGVQLAHLAGAHVIGTGRASVRSSVLEMGADRFVDLEQDAGGTRLVRSTWSTTLLAATSLEPIHGHRQAAALVTVMLPPAETRPDIRTVHFIREPGRTQLHQLAQMVDDGKLRTHVDAVYPLVGSADRVRRSVQPQSPGQGHSAALTVIHPEPWSHF